MCIVVGLLDFGDVAYATGHAAALAISGSVFPILRAAPICTEVMLSTLCAKPFPLLGGLLLAARSFFLCQKTLAIFLGTLAGRVGVAATLAKVTTRLHKHLTLRAQLCYCL